VARERRAAADPSWALTISNLTELKKEESDDDDDDDDEYD
jgi:hypothetical protein